MNSVSLNTRRIHEFYICYFVNLFSKKALKVTNNSGLQPALDWLEANGDDETNFIEDNSNEEAASSTKAKTCLMCNACKKKFTTLEQAELHAARTSHDDFVEAAYEAAELDAETCNEPVPELTKEQKAARLEELRAKLALKKAAKEKEAKEAETLRKASAKELDQVRREMQAKEMKKLAEERRLEKIADKKRREEIKLQIEEDRINKKRQIEAEKAKLAAVGDITNHNIVASAVMTDAPVAASTNSSSSSSARIQVRLPAPNPPLKLTFDSPATQTLKDLKARIKAECPAVKAIDELIQTFPTRVFGKAEDGCTLNELGLAPSASLILK